jgi:hypothetical protein
MQQLKFDRANYDNMAFNAVMFSGREGRAAEADWASQNYQQFSDLLDQASPCPHNPLWEDPPSLSVDEDCEIRYRFAEEAGTASIEEVRDGVNSCDELVEAEFTQAEAVRQICLAERHQAHEWTLQQRIKQDLDAARSKLDVMELRLIRYEAACSVAPDSQAAQQAVEDELAPLTPDPKPKAKKKKAKRSGKKQGRR